MLESPCGPAHRPSSVRDRSFVLSGHPRTRGASGSSFPPTCPLSLKIGYTLSVNFCGGFAPTLARQWLALKKFLDLIRRTVFFVFGPSAGNRCLSIASLFGPLLSLSVPVRSNYSAQPRTSRRRATTSTREDHFGVSRGSSSTLVPLEESVDRPTTVF